MFGSTPTRPHTHAHTRITVEHVIARTSSHVIVFCLSLSLSISTKLLCLFFFFIYIHVHVSLSLPSTLPVSTLPVSTLHPLSNRVTIAMFGVAWLWHVVLFGSISRIAGEMGPTDRHGIVCGLMVNGEVHFAGA